MKMIYRQDPDELREYLEGVTGCIEATHNEKYHVWKENEEYTHYSWVDTGYGLIETVGEIDDRPINIELFTCTINGYKLLFYDGISQLVDYKMLREWLEANLPESAFLMRRDQLRLNHVDATNWSTLLPRKMLCKEKM